jgi:hypothetical protein
MNFVANSLIERGLLSRKDDPFGLTLSFSGWGKYEELLRGSPSGRNVFMAMKFDADLRRLVDQHFRPSVEETGFTLFQLPTILAPMMAPIAMSVRRDIPHHMTILPGGGSLARAR